MMKTILSLYRTLQPENTELHLDAPIQGYNWSNQYLTLENKETKACVQICHHQVQDEYCLNVYEGNFENETSKEWAEKTEKTARLILNILEIKLIND